MGKNSISMKEQPTPLSIDPVLIVEMISAQTIEYLYTDHTDTVAPTIVAACIAVNKQALQRMFGRLQDYDSLYNTRIVAEYAHILCNHSSEFEMCLQEERHFQLFRNQKWICQCQWREFALEPNRLYACRFPYVAAPTAPHHTVIHIFAA
jgi:hypothetical protein